MQTASVHVSAKWVSGSPAFNGDFLVVPSLVGASDGLPLSDGDHGVTVSQLQGIEPQQSEPEGAQVGRVLTAPPRGRRSRRRCRESGERGDATFDTFVVQDWNDLEH